MTRKTPTTAGNSGTGAKAGSNSGTSSSNGSGSSSSSSKKNVGAISWGTAAGVVVVALGILGVIMFRQRLQRRKPPRSPVDEGRVHIPVVELSAGGL